MLAIGIALAVVPGAVLHFVATEKVAFGSAAHTLFVGITAAVATIAAIALTVAAARRRDGRAVVLG